MSTESASEDDNFGTENSQVAILAVLGRERRDRVLAGLYMGRSDTALMVRQAALHVWKVIVAHTPKMLREIMSTLFQLLLGCLASQSYDKRQVLNILTGHWAIEVTSLIFRSYRYSSCSCVLLVLVWANSSKNPKAPSILQVNTRRLMESDFRFDITHSK